MYYYVSYIIFQEMDAISHLLAYGLKKKMSRWQVNCYLSTQSTVLQKQFCQTCPSILTSLKMV